MSSYPIIDIEGIGKAWTAKLKKAGILSTGALLKRAKTRKMRSDLAAELGCDDARILKWANMADLMRVKGVGEEYSELLEAAGVDTVKELKSRKPANLNEAILAVGAKKKMVRQMPGLKRIEGWVAHAKTLSPMLTY
jgi:predicted flap endonuclease-1-like 5' DNA nuclease